MREICKRVDEAVANALDGAGGTTAFAVPSLPGASAALVILALKKRFAGRDIFVIAATRQECEMVFSDIHAFEPSPSAEPFLLQAPSGDGLRDGDGDGMRMNFARALSAKGAEGRIFIATSSDLLAPMPDPEAVAEYGLTLESQAAAPVAFSSFAERLAEMGYARKSEVTGKMSFAVRGGLIDVWPPTAPLPSRIDFFGDDIDSIRLFDPVTQRSRDQQDSLWIPQCDLKAMPSIAPAGKIAKGSVVLWLEWDRVECETRLPDDDAPSPEAYGRLAEAVEASAPSLEMFTGEPAPPKTPTLPLRPLPPPGLADIGGVAADPLLRLDARKSLLAELSARAAAGESVYVCIDTAGGMEWLARELPGDSGIGLSQALLSGGFSWPELKLTVLAQPDIYSTRKVEGRHFASPSVKYAGERVERPEELRPGDLVVHLDHGIGRFRGTVQIETGGRPREVFEIEYAEGALLHVPVSQAHLLSRYIGVAGKGVTLHKLGGTRWSGECVKAQKAVADYASTLLELQARRDALPGIQFDSEPPWMDAFEASFPYVETRDQANCIEAVKRDMARPHPMDRLICGDAGYGKTEVAMRAAFIAVMNGRQVAVLAPTTILAEQHYATFKERMAAFPVSVEVVSRLRSRGARERILERAANGSVDILIGTHAILRPGVAFRNLGLAIIDEEQRFGVGHKERMKMMRSDVDVLTLSATPIPRTLYMSMVGARDMSLLQTPPQERLEIDTKVVRDSDTAIRQAVTRELARGGQVFFLHNRVLTIGIAERRLRSIVPEARIGVAHGQMKPAELGETMRRFEAGEFDLLLSTSIVESGLDIPRANTIIIDRADRFGLAELYQLRGRVGRSSRRGYALLLIPEQGLIDSDARERIKAIQRHGGLSGGLGLALRDLEIRGAGNILGAEQSGHIASIGFGLYCQLLKRTVARLRGEKPPDLIDVDLLIDFIGLPGEDDGGEGGAASIPPSYIDDESLRMAAYRRIAEASSVPDVRAIGEELEDRFGAMPPQARRMLRIAELRIVASRKGIRRIEVKDGVVRPSDIHGRAMLGPGGRFPRVKGTDIDDMLTSLFRAVSRVGG